MDRDRRRADQLSAGSRRRVLRDRLPAQRRLFRFQWDPMDRRSGDERHSALRPCDCRDLSPTTLAGVLRTDRGTLSALCANGLACRPGRHCFSSDGSVFCRSLRPRLRHPPRRRRVVVRDAQPARHDPTNASLDPSNALGVVLTEAKTGALYAIATPGRPSIQAGENSVCSIWPEKTPS
jgi:hypothetical protein